MGTAFLVCPESGAPRAYKDAVLAARDDDTVLTRAFSGRLARGIANSFTTSMKGASPLFLRFPSQNNLTRPMRSAGAAGHADYLSLFAGQAASLAREIPAAELVDKLVRETATARAALQSDRKALPSAPAESKRLVVHLFFRQMSCSLLAIVRFTVRIFGGRLTMRQIKFGMIASIGDFTKTRALAERGEELGFYSVSVADHLINTFGKRLPELECYTALTAIALITKRVRLLPLVTAMSYRNPALLGKITSTLDHISGGRLIAGLGSGWLKREYDGFGYPYPSNAERIDQLAEGIQVLKAMWTQDEPVFHGRYFSIDKAYNVPKPIQKPHPPILVGGAGSAVLKVAAREADILNLIAPVTRGAVDFKESARFDKPDLKRRLGLLHKYAREAGRDPDSIEISSLSTTFIAADKSQGDAMAKRAAENMGSARRRGRAQFSHAFGWHSGGSPARDSLPHRRLQHHLLHRLVHDGRVARTVRQAGYAGVCELSAESNRGEGY